MGISDFLAGIRRRGELVKHISDEDMAQTKVEQRKLSANERMLNKMVEEERQELIKRELARRVKTQEKDYWKKDIITQKNLFTQYNGNSLLRWNK